MNGSETNEEYIEVTNEMIDEVIDLPQPPPLPEDDEPIFEIDEDTTEFINQLIEEELDPKIRLV